MGSRPCRRAIDGSSTPTTAMVLPTPTAVVRSSERLRANDERPGKAGDSVVTAPRRETRGAKGRHLESVHDSACEVS